MRCSICGSDKHNARTCPLKDKDIPRDHAFWVKFDNLTQRESLDLKNRIEQDKDRIAPKARGTSVRGKKTELPTRIQEALKLLGGGNGSEKK